MRFPHFLSLVFCWLFFGCGNNSEPKERGLFAKQDTMAMKAELDSAKVLLRKGAVDEAGAIARSVYDMSLSSSILARQRATALGVLGIIQQERADPDSALILYREGLRVSEEAEDKEWVGAMWLNIGTALEQRGDYEGALEAALKALRIKEGKGDRSGEARVLHNMSVLYWRQDNLPGAIDVLQRSIAIKRGLDPSNMASSLNGLGVLLIEAQKYDSAIAVLHESLADQDRNTSGANRQIQLTNLGLAFDRASMSDSALFYYEQGLKHARTNADAEMEVRALYGISEVLMTLGRFKEAAPLLDSSLAVAERLGALEDMKEAHISMVRLCEGLGDPVCALHHYREYDRLSDSLMNAGTDAAMDELRLRYDTEKHERENEELRAAKEVTDLRADRNRWIAIGIGVLAIAFVVVAWAIAQRMRQRARQQQAELEQQALRLQMDPHFLFNALNTIPGMYAGDDAAAANDHVGHLSQFLRLVLETSRRRIIPLSQELELMEHYLRISANRKPDSFTWEVKVMPYVQPERVAIPPMLIQPLVENAIEHGFSGMVKGNISVLVDRAGSVLHIEVKDNGVGRTAASQRPSRRNGTSMGIDLVRQRIALFDKKADMNAVEVRDERSPTGEPGGTTVVLRIRVQTLSEHAAAGDHR